jgi:hypothetical protein
MKTNVRNRSAIATAALAIGAMMGVTPAFAEIPQLSHTASGHEVRWTNGCFGQYNPKGEATYFSAECNDKKIEKSNALVRLYIELHKGKSHNDHVEHKGGSVQRLQSGGYEVTWQSDCFAQFNSYGQAMSYSEGCDDTEIAKSSRLVADYRRKHGYH